MSKRHCLYVFYCSTCCIHLFEFYLEVTQTNNIFIQRIHICIQHTYIQILAEYDYDYECALARARNENTKIQSTSQRDCFFIFSSTLYVKKVLI